MKIDELKKLMKQVVKEVFQEELKVILLEALKSNKSPIQEGIGYTSPQTYTSGTSPTQQPITTSTTNIKKSYMDVLNEMKAGPKSPLEGEMKFNPGIDTISEGSSLPQGQVGLDQIMNLINIKK